MNFSLAFVSSVQHSFLLDERHCALDTSKVSTTNKQKKFHIRRVWVSTPFSDKKKILIVPYNAFLYLLA